MNYASTFLIVATAALLLACGKTETPSAPDAAAPVTEAPQADPEMVVAAEAPTPVAETPPTAQPEAPAATSRPTTAKPAEAPAAQPAPVVVAAPPAAPSDLVHGQQIYRQACAFCHDRGVAGAPKTGDVAAWNARLAQGMDALYTAAIRGKGAMPAKGGNPSLSDTDVNAAVDYMIAQSR